MKVVVVDASRMVLFVPVLHQLHEPKNENDHNPHIDEVKHC